MVEKTEKEMVAQAWEEWNVKYLCYYYFREDISDLQAELIRKVVWWKELKLNKIIICAMTRWGKTYCVSRAIGLYILSHQWKKMMLVGPQRDQAAILRDYMTDLVLKCEGLMGIADLEITGKERLKKEASRTRLTFSNNCEYRVFSAHGTATGLMGFGIGSGGGIIVKDEAGLIDDGANAKITRMIGDNPEETLFIELLNPWDRDNKSFEHWNDPDWHKIHVGWKDAIKDGRTTQDFIDGQRKELTPLEFEVLYESNFPMEAEDSIFNLAKIKLAIASEVDLEKELNELEEIIKNPTAHQEGVVLKARSDIQQYTKIISCDVADKGLDETVMLWGIKKKGFYQVIGYYSEPKTESDQLSKRIEKKIEEFIGRNIKGEVNIDCIGYGAGPVSNVKSYINEHLFKNVKVTGAHFGESPINKDRFKNKKAENYFRLRDIFAEGYLKIPEVKKLTNQLMNMKWDKAKGSEKIVIVDPDKSPDWPDALVYFIWKDNKDLVFDFV